MSVPNKYSNLKLAWFPDKLRSFAEGRVTAPLYVRFKPTNRCMHACKWCIYGHGDYHGAMHQGMEVRDEIPTHKAVALLRELASIGTKAITFSGGGEPLGHHGIAAMFQTCLDVGLDLSIITNGQLLSGERAELLSRGKWVRVSIDYVEREGFAESRQVKPSLFDQIDTNMRKFVDLGGAELTVNFIITRENHWAIPFAANWLRDVGAANIRFSPVWMDDMEAYHRPIERPVLDALDSAKRFERADFKVYSSYRLDPNATKRACSKCWFQQIVPVIGADQCVYACHNTAYSDKARIGSVRDCTFSDLWFSEETQEWFDAFDAKTRCNGIQCAAEAKNVLYNELVDCHGDNFV